MVNALGIDPAQESIEKAGLPTLLQESWQRSMRHGLRRQDQALFSTSVTRALERRVVEQNRFLLKHASPEMARLYTGLGSARWVSLCANTQGQVVCSVGDHAAAPREIQTLMHPGRCLLEADLGTTAPGCALAAERPVVVEREEHFLFELSSFFCACSPIYTPDGLLAGVLDISGVDVQSIPLAQDMVGLAVRAIENSMIRDIPACSFYRFHCDERLVGTPFEAMLAVDADGLIKGANQTACQLLALPRAAAVSRHVSAFFDKEPEKLRNHSPRVGGFMQVRSTSGAVAHLVVESAPAPVRARSTHELPPPRTMLSNGRPFVLKDADLLRDFERAASMLRHGLPVLLEGETGTGKEVLARALQEATRPDGPFVALNCAAIPEGLIEAELFGYADGAFTGGRRGGSPGKIEQANHGVLFLDEIGDMALGLQTRLLRVLQERVVTRVGEHSERPVDILVLSATHSKLDQLVARGTFREDLYYRLNGCTLHLPALRERNDLRDVAAELLIHFEALIRAGDRAELDALITPEAFECLVTNRWPGNIRQLEQTVRGLLALRLPPARIAVDDLPEAMRTPPTVEAMARDSALADTSSLEAAEEQVIRRVLREKGGNVSATARALGVSRTTIYAKLRRE
jgi:transcriptional regulator of acetoin/glycerol metabolism